MKRQQYYNYINNKLSSLATAINTSGKLNLLDKNIHCEVLFKDFFNLLYKWKLSNVEQNADAIDLIDDANAFVVQVSSTNTKQKIESSLNKDRIRTHPRYAFKFISISKSAAELRGVSYKNPYGIQFDADSDIYDQESILRDIYKLPIVPMREIYDFIKMELGGDIDDKTLESNLSKIISILAKEDWDQLDELTINPFEIDRKIDFNNLIAAKSVIDDYKTHYARVDKIYTVFDSQGLNQSNSVLSKVRRIYNKNKTTKSDDELFFSVAESTVEFLLKNGGVDGVPIDVIELCVDILVVDAFIRCKIFENPNGYKYAST